MRIRAQRILATLLAFVAAAGLLVAVSAEDGVPPAAQQTEIPPTSAPPTSIPPTSVPPTSVPPTSVPPTSVPTAEPTLEPTSEPTSEPTEEPTEIPTEVPTEEPTSTPAPFPTEPPPPPPPPPLPPPTRQPPPTPAPVVRAADVTCGSYDPLAGTPAATPGAAQLPETGAWALRQCSLEMAGGPFASVQLRAVASTPGWEVILVDEDAPDTPGLLDASNNLVTVRPDEGESRVRFLLGMRRSCTAFPAAEVAFAISAQPVTGGAAAVTATASLTWPAPGTPAPVLDLVSVHVDTEREPAPTTIRLRYDAAPERCGWQAVVTLDGSGDVTWEVVAVDAPDGATVAMADGVISLLLPAGAAAGDLAIVLVPSDVGAEIGPLRVEAFAWP